MLEDFDGGDYQGCLRRLLARLEEPAPGRLQLLTGPRQVGKTTLLLELAGRLSGAAVYAAADGPEASAPGFWERLWGRAEEIAAGGGRVVLLLDEVQHLPRWAERLKGEWDRVLRLRLPVHAVVTGSSALRLDSGSRESLAGRFERLTLGHWPAGAVGTLLGLTPEEAAEVVVRLGSYPGALPLRDDLARYRAYVRDAIVEPAIGRDILSLATVRKPALLRQVFALCAAMPAQVVSLQKLQGRLPDPGALETIAGYLRLLEEAFLVAALDKYSTRPLRRRSSPPKVVVLNNAILAASEPTGSPLPGIAEDPARFGSWVENACLAHAWNCGQQVSYWREEPLEVDAVLEGSWGSWAIEVKTGRFDVTDLRGLLELTRRQPHLRPLVLTEPRGVVIARRAGVDAMPWARFLVEGPQPER
jgi:uncharacterized protein